MWSNIRGIDEALKVVRNNYKELTIIIHKQEKQIQFLETKALNLSMFYVASQLIIFLTNSKPSSYQCRNWWKPFFLSLSIAILFGLNFSTTIIKYATTKYEQDRNFIDQQENYHHMANLERSGQEIDMSESYNQTQQLQPDVFTVYQRYAHIGLTVFALITFTALVLHTCRSAACATVA